MKRILSLLLLTLGFGTIQAIGYEDARREAWFLTDKMAYELNLTSEQFDRAYQVNLDYLMSINTADDCYGYYWTYRDADFRCILFDWQYSLYSTLDYFYRPIRWLRSAWYYPIFDRYRRGYYYFSRPTVYASYRGGMWRRRGHNDLSPYRGMTFRPGHGMRDRYHGNQRPAHRPEYGRPGNNRPGGHKPDANRPGNDKTDNNRPGADKNNNRPGNGNSGNYRPGNNRPGNGNSGNYRPDNNRSRNNRSSVGRGTTGGGSYSRPGGRSTRSTSATRGGSTTRSGSGRTFGR